jgi:hypothetical protein
MLGVGKYFFLPFSVLHALKAKHCKEENVRNLIQPWEFYYFIKSKSPKVHL